jgi:hypothetical protein
MDGGLIDTLTAIKDGIDTLDFVELIQNPYVLTVSVIFCGVAVARQMLRSVVAFLCLVAVGILFHYPMPTGDPTQVQGEHLVMFGAGGMAIAGVLIYFVFIRE